MMIRQAVNAVSSSERTDFITFRISWKAVEYRISLNTTNTYGRMMMWTISVSQ